MPQEREYGAAQPVVDFLRKGVDTVRNTLNAIPPQPRKPDNSWLAQRAAAATETFRQAQEKERAAAAAKKRPAKRSSAPVRSTKRSPSR